HGMEERAGFSTPNLLEAETNRAMIRSGRRLVVLTDSSKWGLVCLSSMARLSDADLLISDTGLSAQASAILAERVGRLVLVDPPPPTASEEGERQDAARTRLSPGRRWPRPDRRHRGPGGRPTPRRTRPGRR